MNIEIIFNRAACFALFLTILALISITYGFISNTLALMYAGIALMTLCMLTMGMLYIIKRNPRNVNHANHANQADHANIIAHAHAHIQAQAQHPPIIVIVHQPSGIRRLRLPKHVRIFI
jgi:hypothetical protein